MLKVLIASLLFIQGGPASPLRETHHEQQVSPPGVIKDILWWFPEDTETITVARGPFKAIAIDPNSPPKDLTQAFRHISFGAFAILQDGEFYRQIHGQTVLLSVEASRRFRSPAGLGGMLYEGCTAIYFEQGFANIKESLAKSLIARAKEIQDINGHQVMRFEEKWENDQWKIYVALPQENLLLCATDQGFLRETLSRMNTRSARRALPQDLPEWESVDAQAEFWGIRHYARKDFSDDPSSPLSGEKRTYNLPDKEAIGLVYSFDPGHANQVRIKYLSTNKDAISLAREYWNWPAYKLKPAVRSNKLGVDISFVPDNSGAHLMIMLLILGVMGHGVYI